MNINQPFFNYYFFFIHVVFSKVFTIKWKISNTIQKMSGQYRRLGTSFKVDYFEKNDKSLNSNQSFP